MMGTERTSTPIPTIDFSPYTCADGAVIGKAPTVEQLAVSAQIDSACRHTGFMFLQNIGLNESDLKSAFDASSQLFALSDSYKRQRLKQNNPSTNSGYTGFGRESLNTKRGPDLKEVFSLCNKKIYGDHHLQECPKGFAEIYTSFWDKIETACANMLIACAIALDIPSDFFRCRVKTFDALTIAPLHYPPCAFEAGRSSGEDLSAAVRNGEHTDFGIFTFLFNDGPGLQVKAVEGGEIGGIAGGESGGWTDVPVAGGTTAIVNTGALMARWTNDIWRATAHRVIVSSIEDARRHRYAIACFCHPDKDQVVEVHSKFVEAGSKPKYDAITSREYVEAKMREAQGRFSDSAV